MAKRSFLLLFALALTACATSRTPRPFDPAAFLNAMRETGEGTCNLTDGSRRITLPCRFYESDDSANTYIAIYHPKLGILLSIRELRPDGTQTSVWSRPSETRPAKATGTIV